MRRKRDSLLNGPNQFEWFCNFQSDPINSPDDLLFDPRWFSEEMFYDFPKEALPPAKFKLMCTDPSMGAGNESNDFFASLYLHIAHDSTIYVEDSFLSVCKPDFMVPMVTGLVARHQEMDFSAWEDNSGGIYAAELVKRECDSRGLRFPIIMRHYGRRWR